MSQYNSQHPITQPDHQARKRFGQNFLHDAHVIRKIVQAIGPQPDQHLLEIGPGQGALTIPLVNSGAKLDVVELDRDLAAWLQNHFADCERFTLHLGDVLKFDLKTLTQKPRSIRVIGNLPYNISTPCLFHLLESESLIDDMTFMLQKEVVQRLAAGPDDDEYGRLSVMVQYFCTVEHLFDVPPGAFKPAPKVTSAIVRLRPHREYKEQATDTALLRDLVRTAFSQRRKTLRNCIKPLIVDLDPQDLPVDLSLRPENVGIADYVRLSNKISSLRAASAP
ncbi:MAG: 16S rRNA (adenine(1518)-N(6)/adenine(1519)-N(6))-dimethyltransferase RsmA [Pseudohongiella sp.]|nr:16S rRNA (adenine(1518)-N(6)/adenine(1519)-N(6))-dimethyltransferase RsmA [Pseudohongiella sp.]